MKGSKRRNKPTRVLETEEEFLSKLNSELANSGLPPVMVEGEPGELVTEDSDSNSEIASEYWTEEEFLTKLNTEFLNAGLSQVIVKGQHDEIPDRKSYKIKFIKR
jgi:hypothetical protein